MLPALVDIDVDGGDPPTSAELFNSLVLCPERAIHISPRQRLGKSENESVRTLKGCCIWSAQKSGIALFM